MTLAARYTSGLWVGKFLKTCTYQEVKTPDRRGPAAAEILFEPDGSIQVKAETLPSAAVLWQAANPIVRDFRLEGIGSAYRSSLDEADAIVIELGREIFGARKVASAIFARSSQQFGRRARAHPYQDFF